MAATQAPEYDRDIKRITVGSTDLVINAFERAGNIGARLTGSGDTMLLGRIQALARPYDGWFAHKLMDLNATATLSLKLDVTDGTDTINIVPTTVVGDLGVVNFIRFSTVFDFLGERLSITNRNTWDIIATATVIAATAGTVGRLMVHIGYDMDESYGRKSDGT